jgi:hypothetical protein
MSNGKKAGIIVGCVVAAIVIVIIARGPSIIPSLGPLEPTVSIDYEVVILNNGPYLSVRVEGPERDYTVLLFDSEDEQVDGECISYDDMIPGHATAEIWMAETGGWVQNPIPGQYRLVVKESDSDRRVFDAKLVFEGPHINIMNVQFVTGYRDHYGFTIDEVTVQVYNSGDLPVFVDKVKLLVAGEEEDISFLKYKPLPHGETTAIETSASIWDLKRQTYQATVEIYSDGVKLDSYETQVTFQ